LNRVAAAYYRQGAGATLPVSRTMNVLRLCIALIATFVAPAVVAAQPPGRLDARLVHERTGAPVAGASVSIVGALGVARTDGDGRFTWSPVPPMPCQVIIVLADGQIARPAFITSLHSGTTSIPVGALTDEVVAVLGAAPSISTPPASATTILSAEQIASRVPESLVQALETVPGTHAVSEGHAAVPAIRGLARGRTLLLLDGGRVSSERRVGPGATFLDPAVVAGVDIARGPGSVAYGSDALGGVISVRTRRAEPGSPLRARFVGSIGAGVPMERGVVEVSKGLEQGGVLVQAHVRNAEDYNSPRQSVYNSGWEDRGFLVHVTRRVAAGFLAAAWQSDDARNVERPRNDSNAVRFYHPFERSHRFTGSYERLGVAGFQTLAVTGFLGTSALQTDQDRSPAAGTQRRIDRADVSANDFHVKASAERRLARARLEFGTDINGRYNLEAFDNRATERAGTIVWDATTVSVEDARRIDTGVYLQSEAALGRMARVSAGLRTDRVTTTNTGGFFGNRSTVNVAASGFGAVTLDPFAGLSVTTQASRGFRDPTLSDRYFRGPSGRGVVTGNPLLHPETTVQFDLATRYTRSRTQLAVFFYHYRVDDLVERYQTQTDVFHFRNRGRAHLRGVEVEARSTLGRGYSVEVAGHKASGRALDDGTALDDSSPGSLSVFARKAFGARMHAQARVEHTLANRRPGPTEIETPSATVVDVGTGIRLGRQLVLSGLLRNLLDDEHYASPDPRWVLAPGRSASLTAELEF
jgi:hemoglobin/transferrin/lactoferrin receptor protein